MLLRTQPQKSRVEAMPIEPGVQTKNFILKLFNSFAPNRFALMLFMANSQT
jgi:hypothetical protein